MVDAASRLHSGARQAANYNAGVAPALLSREMRLLILTIVVSGGVLLLLARLRFPEAPPAADVAVEPLQQLAARASFEELATRVARLEAAVAPNLLVLRLAPDGEAAPVRFADLTARLTAVAGDTRHVPALRLDASTALAIIPPPLAIAGLVTPTDPTATVSITARDALRHVARLRVPGSRARSLPVRPLSALQTPTYVVAVEGTRAGVTVRPVFLGRSDRFGSARWTSPLLPIGGVPITPGALVFTLEGEFLGCVVVEEGILAVAGASDVLDAAARGSDAQARLIDPGLTLLPLTADLSAATGATQGLVVTEVMDGSPAAGVVEAGDVMTAVAGASTTTPEAVLLDLATRLPRGEVAVTVVRGGDTQTVTLVVRDRATAENRLTVQLVRGVGSRVVAVADGSGFAGAGLTAGDLIVRAGGVMTPTPTHVRSVLRDSTRTHATLSVRRGSSVRMIVVATDGQADVTTR